MNESHIILIKNGEDWIRKDNLFFSRLKNIILCALYDSTINNSNNNKLI